MFKKKIVLVAGPGNSGSGALHDLLLLGKNFVSPFENQEFRMINDPNGLDQLYNCFYKNTNFYNYSVSLQDFISYNQFLSDLKVNIHNKKTKLIKNKKKYNSMMLGFIKKIIDVEYYAYPQFSKHKLGYLKNLNFKLNNLLFKIKKKNRPYRMIIPKNEKIFVKESKKLIESLFLNNLPKNLKKKNLLINQGLNIFDPIGSTKYYRNPKIIIVLRDPKSIYYSMKSRKSYAYPGYNLDLFINWYGKYMNKFRKLKNKNIIYIRFEKFFLDYDKEKKKLNKFLNIEIDPENKFDIEKTRNNIYKAKKYLSKNEINKINLKLKKYLYW